MENLKELAENHRSESLQNLCEMRRLLTIAKITENRNDIIKYTGKFNRATSMFEYWTEKAKEN